jgi:hypothetical protein
VNTPGSSAAFALLPFKSRVLLIDQALVELLEERRRPPERLSWRKVALCPGSDGTAVVVGQSRVRPGLLLVLHHVPGAKELPVVAQEFNELLRCVG